MFDKTTKIITYLAMKRVSTPSLGLKLYLNLHEQGKTLANYLVAE